MSRNVFKDLSVPNADEHFVKAELVFKIDTIMKKRKMKQVEAAGLFGVRQPDVSKMLRGEFHQFSVERLMRFLVALDQDVEIVVTTQPLSMVLSYGSGGGFNSSVEKILSCPPRGAIFKINAS